MRKKQILAATVVLAGWAMTSLSPGSPPSKAPAKGNTAGDESLGGPPRLSVYNLIAGSTATFMVTRATAGGIVGIGASTAGAGPFNVNIDGCGLQAIDLSLPITLLGTPVAGGDGTATLPVPVPPGTSGIQVFFDAFDIGDCDSSDGIARTIG